MLKIIIAIVVVILLIDMCDISKSLERIADKVDPKVEKITGKDSLIVKQSSNLFAIDSNGVHYVTGN